MKTVAALGLLLFSGVLVVSGAMMGTVGAEPDVAPAPDQALGPCEIRVRLRGPGDADLPPRPDGAPAILVEPIVHPGDGTAPRPSGGKDARRLALEWVPAADDRHETGPLGQERRDADGYAARVVVLDRGDAEDPCRAWADAGGYWRAVYAPRAGTEAFAVTVIIEERGATRTIAGFVHPPADGFEAK